MNAFRRSLSTMVLAGGFLVGGFYGGQALFNSQFARAAQNVDLTREQLSKVEDLSTVFKQVGKAVSPSVVNINVIKKVPGHGGIPHDDDLLRRFFHDQIPDMPEDPNSQNDDGTQEERGTGSGVIMEAADGNGYILTNNHVAGGAEKLEVTLADGRVIDNAKVLGADAKSDLAVVQIKADRLIPAHWGNSDELQQGDWIMAFGSPFGYVGSMTHGIVSALNRTNVGILGQQGYEDFIQVDAPINPGNSGGPLVNIRGEVVGINTAIASRSGGFQGIGFAIPSNQAKFVYESLKTNHKVTRGWLGVSIADVSKSPDLAKSFGFTGTDGVLVQETFPNTPAAGKLQEGDIITGMNGKDVLDVQTLRNAIAASKPGEDVKFQVFRSGKTEDVSIKIGEQPEDLTARAGHSGPSQGNGEANPSESANADALGLKFGVLTDELAKRLNIDEGTKGALVTAVKPRSPAASEGLQAGDVITRVESQPVAGPKEAADALNKADLSKGIRLYAVTPEGSRFFFLKQEAEAK